ncbi:TM0106 family RecB-like putative nuclease [Frankia sp. Cppng1_Ct_nod]|uniref:TM0106 family RecB-like putative nuclease n=1 Tax=Frankia sp. Cppng1_Ct_nod TaxID=2897162 RepID=UPI0020254018|nr:TM0106 family RecB-like putative nuclease [Frankia sp. Cppng1_Ct_nod]
MQRFEDRWVVSAGDVVDSLECGHRLVLSHARAAGVRVDAGGAEVTTSEADELLVRHGDAHERRWLAHLVRVFGADEVTAIERPENTLAALGAARERTREAVAAGVAVIYQGVLFDGSFQGRPDFLIATHLDPITGARTREPVPGRYEPYDAKLARHARPAAVLQLAAYAQALPAIGVDVALRIHLLLGDSRLESIRVEDVAPMVDHARARLATQLAAEPTVPEPSWADPRPACGTCAFTGHCEKGREAARDLSLVAGMRTDSRRKLRAAGISSVEDLAVAGDAQRPPSMAAATFAGLRLQAELQVIQDATRTDDDRTGTVTVRVVAPDGLASLPVPDAGDIYFDMEGDPYALDNTGLEYLFGAVTLDETGEVFHPFWAHDRAAEKRAFERFVDWATGRLNDHPRAHIYHYAPYEPNALKRLAARHGTREQHVDALLAGHRLVDLYTVVRRSLKISQRSYSIKYLEPLYMPGARGAEVKNAVDSIVAYENVLAHLAGSDHAAADHVLGEIAEYNRVDCVSTHRLHRWLLDLRTAEGIMGVPTDAPPGDVGDDGAGGAGPDSDATVDALVAGLPDDPATWTDDERARALLAAAVGYHRRENKPAWWEFFAWLTADHAALEADDNCAVPLSWTTVEGWAAPTGRQKKTRRTLRASLDPERNHPFADGERIRLLYPPGTGRADGTTHDAELERGEPDTLLVRETAPPDDAGADLPLAVLPGAPVNPRPKPAAIAELARTVAANLSDGPAVALPDTCGPDTSGPDACAGPAMDLLRRCPPRLVGRLTGRAGLPDPAEHGGDLIPTVLAAVDALDGSYLAVQGPPGAGKTYLAGRLIRHLVGRGRTVGVCSTSHKAIENAMLAAIGDSPDGGVHAAKKVRSGHRPDPGLPWDCPRDIRALASWRAAHPGGHLVGDTAWAFANPVLRAEPFDVMIIDEAGQFALADTLAVAGAARNLVLLGDPQQLPQVVAGIHPDGADASALSHLLGADEVIPGRFGYFLDLTRRMHPDVCAPVSALAYRGRLHAHPVAADRRISGVDAGLYLRDVVHHGATTRSDAEVAVVVDLVGTLLGRRFVDGDTERLLDGCDVLVVAPYNRQVRAIEHALGKAGIHGVRVGTVDRFQGQEAPAVIMSMTTSSAAEAPRGLDFLLSRNRLNVALSRAQVLAVLVMSPALLDSAARTVDELRLLAGLARLRTTARIGPPTRIGDQTR